MILSSKVTWGLAWTGLAVILAVPSADFVTGALSGGKSAAVVTSTTDPVKPAETKTASVTTTVTKSGVTITPAGATPPKADPVDSYLKTNKALPSYLTDTTAAAPAATTDTKVATIDPAVQQPAPIPFPRPADIVKPAQPKPVVTTPAPVVDETTMTGSVTQPPVIVDTQPPVTEADPATTTEPGPVPPAAIVDDSASWRAKGLTQYLERNGLIADSQSTLTVTEAPAPDSYDADGFYLSDGPNTQTTRAQRRARILQTFGDDPNAPVPPASFNLF